MEEEEEEEVREDSREEVAGESCVVSGLFFSSFSSNTTDLKPPSVEGGVDDFGFPVNLFLPPFFT